MSTLAWHFTAARNTLRDERKFRRRVWIEHTTPLIMCESGLHASIDPFDALQYAPGSWLWRVECGGEIVHQPDKLVCSRRRVIGGGDATEVLRAFARACASDVLYLWDAPAIVRDYLATGDETKRDAAWDAGAAWDAAWDAAGDAQRKRFGEMVTTWLKKENTK